MVRLDKEGRFPRVIMLFKQFKHYQFITYHDGLLDFDRVLGMVFIIKDSIELCVPLCFLTMFTRASFLPASGGIIFASTGNQGSG